MIRSVVRRYTYRKCLSSRILRLREYELQIYNLAIFSLTLADFDDCEFDKHNLRLFFSVFEEKILYSTKLFSHRLEILDLAYAPETLFVNQLYATFNSYHSCIFV